MTVAITAFALQNPAFKGLRGVGARKERGPGSGGVDHLGCNLVEVNDYIEFYGGA
jgi:hypothetical protein